MKATYDVEADAFRVEPIVALVTANHEAAIIRSAA
jgi:hypothetical protein